MSRHQRVVIVGGGIVGCSTAYHLAKLGEADVLLLEKGTLTSGSTWHAAGLVGQLRSQRNITRMLGYSVELYQSLEAETGQATGWRQVGGLRLACSEARMMELRRAQTTAKSFGLEMRLISPKEAKEMFPPMALDGVLGAAYLPTDGYADPSGITLALAKGASARGVSIESGVAVKDVIVEDGQVRAVVTDKETITCDVLVNCAGMWASELGQMAGVSVPLIPVEHQFMVTEPIAGLSKNLPTLRDPDNLIYYKEEMGGLVMGGYEPNPKAWATRGIPEGFEQKLLEPDFEHFEQLSQAAIRRTPCLESAGIMKLINGPEAFTPDGNFIMGEAPEVKNFYVGAGFNAHGIAAGGGAGRMLAEWVYHGEPSMNMWSADIRRFGPHNRNLSCVTERTLELYGKHYTISWPHEEHASARGIRRSPLYQTLRDKGAVFGSKFGWERPNWFAPLGTRAEDEHSFGRSNCFGPVGEECRAVRERVGLIDQSSFAKFRVSGPGACEFLQYMAVNNVDKATGSLTYTQLCDDKGGIQSDLTIARLGQDEFYIVTGTGFAIHDYAWLERHLPESGVTLQDVTNAYAVLNVCGPRSRDLLARVTDDDISHAGFPFAKARYLELCETRSLALRVTYVGELGWELHVPVEYAGRLYDSLWQAGQDLGIANVGYRAIDSLRLEKGYLYWSTDINPDYNPYQAGLGFCVALKRKGDFLGREALEAVKESGVSESLCMFSVDGEANLLGGEALCHEGQSIGVVTSGGYGYTVGRSIAYAYVDPEHLHHTQFEIESFGRLFPAVKHTHALYDPERKRILC